MTIENNALENFMSAFDFASLIKEPTCYQSENPRCIDLILTNKKEFMKNSKTFEVGISDHHKFLLQVFGANFLKETLEQNFIGIINFLTLMLSKET